MATSGEPARIPALPSRYFPPQPEGATGLTLVTSKCESREGRAVSDSFLRTPAASDQVPDTWWALGKYL